MNLFREKMLKHKIVLGGAVFVGLASSFYYFFLRDKSS